MAPLIGWALRMVGRAGEVKDDFNRSLTGSLGSTSTGGMPWTITTGVWDVNGSRPVTSTSHSSNPVATINPGKTSIESLLTLGTGDALYFRVVDASNWWRALWEGYQTKSCQTCCDTCCSTCCDSCTSWYYRCCKEPDVNCAQCEGCGKCTCDCSQYNDGFGGQKSCIANNDDASDPTCTYSCNCKSCNCYSCNCVECNCTYYDNYRMLLQKMVGGTLTTVTTGPVQSTATTRARVVTDGSTVAAYYGSSGQTLLSSTTQTDHAAATRHGIGRGASGYNSSALDNFELRWN